MKKILLFVLILTATTAMVHSEGINMGDFPLGKWLDAQYDAVWEFQSNNIRILSTDGSVHYDFAGKTIENWSIKPGTSGLVLSFYCPDTGRKYEFTKALTDTSLKMYIVTDWDYLYKVNMPFQK